MRDDRHRWPRAQHTKQAARAFDGLELSLWEPSRAFLVTGPAFMLEQAFRPLGWPDAAKQESARPAAARLSLRLRRDQVLVLDDPGLSQGGLWAEGRGLVTDMSGGYVFAQLDGPRALSVLQTGCALDPAQPSASVVRLWHDFEVMICRGAGEQGYLMGVEAPCLDGLWGRLVTEAETA